MNTEPPHGAQESIFNDARGPSVDRVRSNGSMTALMLSLFVGVKMRRNLSRRCLRFETVLTFYRFSSAYTQRKCVSAKVVICLRGRGYPLLREFRSSP